MSNKYLAEGKPDCKDHPKELFGEKDMKVVAMAIRNLHHESRAILISELANEISAEGWEDEPTKPNLASELFMVAGYLSKAAIHSGFVWDISKKFMNDQIIQP